MRFLLILPVLLPIVCACGGGHSSNDKTVVIDERDSGAYRLGLDHGRILVEEKKAVDSINDFLLEVRARETNIRSLLRESAGDAYVKGFQEYVRSHNDSLARELF